MLLRHQRKQFYEVPLPASVREFSPHGLTFRLVFAVCPVNIKAAALRASGKVECASDGVLKHIKMRKQTPSNRVVLVGLLQISVCVSYCYPLQQWCYHQH